MTRVPPADGTSRPGPVALVVVALGWVTMAIAVRGMWIDPALGSRRSWIVWVLGAAVLHDLVVLPVVVGLGWALGRLVPDAWRLPTRVAVVVGALITAATFPVVSRLGERPDNRSVLPLPAGRNLLVLWGLLALAALLAGAVDARRRVATDATGADGIEPARDARERIEPAPGSERGPER